MVLENLLDGISHSLIKVKNYETPEERQERFKRMSSSERKRLLRLKMKAEGLEEGSGVFGAIYDEQEILELIQITSCFSEIQNNQE